MDPILLVCYLKAKADPNFQLILTHDKLIVVYKGKSQVFYRRNILNIELSKKKLIVPLVIGGIGTSMAIVAMSMGWYHRQLNLFTIFFFFAVMYYGFVGKDALELFEKGHSNVYLINKVLPSIRRFIGFFNSSQAFLQYTGQNFIYHLAEPKEWEEQLTNENYTTKGLEAEGFIHASTREQLQATYERYYSDRDTMVLLTIVPDFLSNKVVHDYSHASKEHFPHIYGPINKTAIVRLMYYTTKKQDIPLE